jgi:hypothetical protein
MVCHNNNTQKAFTNREGTVHITVNRLDTGPKCTRSTENQSPNHRSGDDRRHGGAA